MTKKKIKIKVKKRKLKIKKILLFILVLILLGIIIYNVIKFPIKNIYIIGNNILSDKEIIDISHIGDYPAFITTNSHNIEKNLTNNIYIKEAEVKKKLFGKIYIYIKEKKILCIYDNKLILEDSNKIDNIYNITSSPILLSDITTVEKEFIKKFSMIKDEILLKISEIEYIPNEVDKERFNLKMNDGNLVYITLSKLEKINKYNSIYSNLEGKKGIIYLDSGDYVEIKEN